MRPTILLATAALAVAIAAPAAPADQTDQLTDRQLRELQARESPESLWLEGDWWRDPAKYKRNWQRTKKKWLRHVYVDPKPFGWGNERDVDRKVIILDPPLKRRFRNADRVQLEYFYALPTEDGTTTQPPGLAGPILGRWLKSLRSRHPNGVPLTTQFRLVGKGPTLLRALNPQRRIAQELLYAYQDGTNWSRRAKGRAARDEIYRNARILQSRDTARAAIERLGLSGTEWHWRVERRPDRTNRRIAETDRRFAELMRQARDHDPRALKTPWDPILVIDGRYLLLGSLIPRIDHLLQMANRIIRHQEEMLGRTAVHGEPDVVGANEIEINGQRIRLARIRVPTDDWCARYNLANCEQRARERLRNIVRHYHARWVACSWPDGETVAAGPQPARCELRSRAHTPCDMRVGCGVSHRMVLSGWAFAAPGDAELGELQASAIAKRRGMWWRIPPGAAP